MSAKNICLSLKNFQIFVRFNLISSFSLRARGGREIKEKKEASTCDFIMQSYSFWTENINWDAIGASRLLNILNKFPIFIKH